jgi:hypothetical protein
MTPYERNIFDNKCPYTNKFCYKDIACANCEVNAEERYFEEEFDRSESEDEYISIGITDDCKNLEESYGEICVRGNKCGRFDGEKERRETNE